MHYMK